MARKLLDLLLLLFWHARVQHAVGLVQPTDLAIVGLSAAPAGTDFVVLLALRDWAEGDVIRLTENPVSSSGEILNVNIIFPAYVWSYTVPTGGIAAGERVVFDRTPTNGWTEVSGSLSLDHPDEEVNLYTGSESSPAFIFSLITAGSFAAVEGDVPPGLVEGSTAFALNAASGYFVGDGNFTIPEFLSTAADRNNWVTSADDIPLDRLLGMEFSSGGGNILASSANAFVPTASPSAAPTQFPTASPPASKGLKAGGIAGIVIGGVCGGLICVGIWCGDADEEKVEAVKVGLPVPGENPSEPVQQMQSTAEAATECDDCGDCGDCGGCDCGGGPACC